jgi:hypothetical protein
MNRLLKKFGYDKPDRDDIITFANTLKLIEAAVWTLLKAPLIPLFFLFFVLIQSTGPVYSDVPSQTAICSGTTFEPQNTTLPSEKAHIIRMTNAIWWEDWWILQGHPDYAESHGLGDTYHSDIIPFMNMTFVHWSNGSMTIYPGTVPEAQEFYEYPWRT